jgi:hypothetical protein
LANQRHFLSRAADETTCADDSAAKGLLHCCWQYQSLMESKRQKSCSKTYRTPRSFLKMRTARQHAEESLSLLMKRADAAMYQTKTAGHNRIVAHPAE